MFLYFIYHSRSSKNVQCSLCQSIKSIDVSCLLVRGGREGVNSTVMNFSKNRVDYRLLELTQSPRDWCQPVFEIDSYSTSFRIHYEYQRVAL